MYDLRTRRKLPVDEPKDELDVSTDLRGINPVNAQLLAKYTKPPSSTYSACNSDTDYDDELNALMAESWSALTWSASSSTYTLDDLVREQGAHVAEALRPCSQPLTCGALKDATRPDCAQAAIDFQNISDSGSSVVSHHGSQRTLSYGTSLKRFLDDHGSDAPWSPCNPRRPGSICSFCGMLFTAPHHMTSVVEHIQRRHIHRQQNASPATDRKVTTSGSNESESQNISYQMFRLSSKRRIGIAKASSIPSRNPRAGMIVAQTLPAFRDLVVQQPKLADNHDWTLAILNSLHPHVDAKRPNDFFNTLDLIAGNLLERFPDDAIALGMRRAVARLNSLYGLHFGTAHCDDHPFLGKLGHSTKASATGDGRKDSLPRPSQSLLLSSTQPGDGCGQRDTSADAGLTVLNDVEADRKKAARSKKLKAQHRLLACPIRKHHEVHGHISTCTFKGARHLSSITMHLQRRGHHQEVPFVAVCRHCWEHTVSEHEYRHFHNTRACRNTAQPRYDSVFRYWHQLYLVLFPSSGRVPSPFTDDTSWTLRNHMHRREDNPTIHDTVTSQQLNPNDMSIAQSFLDNSPLDVEPTPPVPMNLDVRSLPISVPDEDQPFFEAIGQLLNEHLHSRFDLSDQITAELAGPQSQLGQEYVTQLADRLHASIDASINETMTSRWAQEHQDHMIRHDMQDPMTFISDSLWLGPRPPAREQFTLSETVQDVSLGVYIDPIVFWTPPELPTPGTSMPATGDRTFVPDLDSIFTREGSVPSILV